MYQRMLVLFLYIKKVAYFYATSLIWFVIFLYNTVEPTADANSAIGKANHTRLTLPDNDNKNAHGNNTNTCLINELIKLYVPFPTAWNTAPKMIQ